MRTMIQIMGCISIMLLLMTGITLSANGRPSERKQEKEKTKISGWIGVMVQDVNKKVARKAKLDSEEGAYVSEVLEDSPADSAGIQESDVIIEFNGKKLFDSDDLEKVVHRTLPETKVSLVLFAMAKRKRFI